MAAPTITAASMTLSNGSTKIPYSNGTFIINTNTIKSIEFSSIICTGKVTIEDLRHVGSGADVRSTYIQNAALGMADGCVITAISGSKFSSIKTDGTAPVILVL